MKKLNEEFKKMENNYRELIKNKDEEYNNNLKLIEKDILEKEQEYDNMKIELNKLENKNKELENVNYDLKKTNQDLQNSLLDALSKNEELTKDLSKYQNKNKSNFQNNNIRNISIQTEQIVTDEVKKKLINLNIKMSDIMENRYYEVILDLVNLIEKFKQGNVVFGGKYGMIIDNSNDNNKKGEEININEYKDMKKKIKEMNEQIEIYEKKFDRALQEKVNQIKNEYHKELEKNNIKRLEINSFANTKNLFRELSGLENDLLNFQRIKKQIQKLDIMLNSDIPNKEKEKNFEQTLNRVDEELKKGQGMLEDIASSPTVYKNYRDKNIGNFREVIDKLTSSLKENKIILIGIINFYMRISKNYYYIYKNKYSEIPNTNEEIEHLEKKTKSNFR